MRPPFKFGLPPKFETWRPGQYEAVWAALDPKFPFVGLAMPTGTGKTAAFAAAASVSGLKTSILTATRYQQDQIMSDFSSMGLVDIRGQSNYPCRYDVLTKMSKLTVDQGPCQFGTACEKKTDGECDYYEILRQAKAAPIMVTNYAYWLHSNLYAREDVFNPDLLVLDEGHAAPQQICDALAVDLPSTLIDYHYVDEFPRGSNPHDWARWFDDQYYKVCVRISDLRSRCAVVPSATALRTLRRLKDLEHKLQRGTEVHLSPWVMRQDARGVRWEPLWPSRYSGLLTQQTPRVVVVSATLRPKTMELLGLHRFRMYECASPFKVSNRLIYVPRSPRMGWKTSDEDRAAQLKIIDTILDTRASVNGVIQTVSYDLAHSIRDRSRHQDRMIVHERRESQAGIREFKLGFEPSILVSPSISTGVDFPGPECRFNIIAKVPFPPQKDPMSVARCDDDPEYMPYSVAQEIEQMVGRGVRSEDDWCENFIVDGNFGWFYTRHSSKFSGQFRESVRSIGTEIPALGGGY